MQDELESVPLEEFLSLVSACAGLREYDPLLRLLAQRAHRLLEFDRLNILLCDNNRQILRTFVIEDHKSREVSPEEIQLSEMDLILQTLVSGIASSGAAGICIPMVSAGAMNGMICLAARSERYTIQDLRFAQLLANYLAGTFERLTQGSTVIRSPRGVATAVPGDATSVAKAHAVSLHMSYLAQHDALTDLPNRLLLYERLDRSLAMSRRYKRSLAVLFLDLDRFKEVNDSLGHAIGDQVLRQISDRLVKCVRSSDTVSRFGGDEFVILLSELEDAKDAAICADKIIASVQAPLMIPSHDLDLTVSIGIGIYPGDGEDAESLIRNADTAMYHAKAAGYGKCHFFKQETMSPHAGNGFRKSVRAAS